MRWASALSEKATLSAAVDDVVADVRAALGDQRPHLLIVFTTMHHGLGWDALPARLQAAFPGARLIGCCGGGVIGEGQEREDTVGLSLTAAVLPDVGIRTFVLEREVVARRDDPEAEAVREIVGVDPDVLPAFLLLAEPYSCNVQGLTRTLDQVYPRSTTVGGIASGSGDPGRHVLFVDGTVVREGVVGVALWGSVVVDTVVAQGCRPVGDPMVVTSHKGSMVLELDGEPALNRLQGTFQALDDGARRLFQVSPMIGVAMDPAEPSPGRGDFLVRTLVGVDPKRGGLVVGHPVVQGDLLQFHARDPGTSVDDLHDLVGRWGQQHGSPEGVLLFTCLGRGKAFYGASDVESRTVRELLGDVPIGGFFCNGEIGPVHGRTFLHGTTSALALFRTPQWN